MVVNWHGKPGWRNKGHEIEYGESAETHTRFGFTGARYYFSLCGHRKDDERFRVFVYCEKGWKHLGEGFDDPSAAKAFVEGWQDEQETQGMAEV